MIDHLMDDKINFSELATHLERRYDRLETLSLSAFGRFIDEQTVKVLQSGNILRGLVSDSKTGSAQESAIWRAKVHMKWEPLVPGELHAIFKPLTAPMLTRLFDKAYTWLEPYFLRDLFSWEAGQILRWDGQYKVAAKIKNDPELGDEANALLLCMGEWGQILSGVFCNSEDDKNVQRMLFIVRQWLMKFHGGQAAVDKIVMAYTDVCCKGLKDPEMHWIQHLFRNIPRAPLKDIFHTMKLVMDAPSTAGAGHPLARPGSMPCAMRRLGSIRKLRMSALHTFSAPARRGSG